MSENNIIKRINKLEAMAANITEELAILREEFNKKEPAPQKKARLKMEAAIIAKRDSWLLKK